jgi:TonB family protein
MKNFRYPEFAQKNGIQGRVFVQFMIGIDGNISGIRTRGPHGSLERAAERIILLLPKMKPGKRNGLRVRTPFSMPITYRLN